VPVRNVNPALASAAAEAALASSRLLPGEAFAAAAFREVATLMNDTAQNAAAVSPMVQTVLTREKEADPFVELRGWPYALALLVEADWRRMLGFGFLDRGSGLTPGRVYDYRITGRFRRRELHEELLGFHTVPLGTTLPTWFHLGPVLVQTPLPTVVELFPKPAVNMLRAAGVKGIALRPVLPGGRCLTLTFEAPVSRVVLELEPTLTQGMHFEARTSDYLFGLTGSLFSGPVAATRRVELAFAEPVDTVRLFGRGFLYGVRVPTQPPAGAPDDVFVGVGPDPGRGVRADGGAGAAPVPRYDEPAAANAAGRPRAHDAVAAAAPRLSPVLAPPAGVRLDGGAMAAGPGGVPPVRRARLPPGTAAGGYRGAVPRRR
jgi:hypothetical protein